MAFSRPFSTFPPGLRSIAKRTSTFSVVAVAALAFQSSSALGAYGFGNFATGSCGSGGSDPVGLFMRTSTASVGPVNNHIQNDAGYYNSDGQDQYLTSSTGCGLNNVWKNNGTFLTSRHHVRGWGARPWSSFWVTAGTPHYDTLVGGCHMVWNGDFQNSRTYLVQKFQATHASHSVAWIWLGNTSSIYKSCGPGYTANDGYAADVKIT
jgi:hypothetical protein